MTGAVVAVEVPVVEDVEVAATAGPVEPVMTQPGFDTAVHDDGEAVDGVEAEHDGDEGGGVVEAGLHRVHAGAREGCGVVGLVVEVVDLSVQNLPQVGDVCCPPGVDQPVDEVEVRGPVVSQTEGHHQVSQWRLGQAGQTKLTGRPGVTERDLQQAGDTAGAQSHHGVVQDLPDAGVGGAHLVLGQLGLEGREVEEPIPAAADDEGGQQVSQHDVRHPVS